MKKYMYSIAVVGAFVLLSNVSLVAQLNLAYINSGRIMAEYKEFQDVAKQLQELSEKYEKDLQSMQKNLEAGYKEFENQQLLLSTERKTEKERQLQEQYQKIMQYREEKFGQQGEINKKRQDLSDPIVERVQNIIDKIGKNENYDFIFDTANGGIVFSKEEKYDITDRVVKELEKGGGISPTDKKN